ncbi:hypothetical protein ABB37_00586 [Leptomonas pyrrhocoris]|uniref:Uncharacterized protein n=1 Tax=Leptomonas pyrrhocoris TaxID=157538 RepID=A0A0N0E0G9_LEPPY|nr:hypothetical protein ABB37_00586 [Leptomonas pyrrhocoris]KPA86408.1 hypothetical protein ABB37_00586 [Leptomonas pyrrhocoris]|eukprot:XP_015664847.1 hypothetical protein ABB37_00586 [Leptomonas pyrrhocoris]
MSKSHSAQMHEEKSNSATVTVGGGLMDSVTAAYVQRYDLAYSLHTMVKILRDVNEAFAPMTPSQLSIPQKSSPSPLASQEGAAIMTSPLGAKEDSFHAAAASSTAGMVDLSDKESPDTNLPLQLLLSFFTPLSTTSAATKGNGVKQYSTPPSPTLSSSLEAVKEAAESGGASPSGSPTSTSHAGPWPAAAAFTTKDAALKAEVCRCFAQQCERLHSGLGLVDSSGSSLRWSDLCPASGGHERVGVALVFDVFRCWRQVVVPLLRTTGDLAMSSDAPAQDTPDVLFEAMLAPSSQQLPESAAAVCSCWCYTLLQGYCQDFPEELWASIVSAGQCAAAAQQRLWRGAACVDSGEVGLPSLTCETLLLRSFMAHLACPAVESFDASPTSSLPSVMTTAHVSAAVTAAKQRSPAWAWAEVEEMREALCQGGTSADDAALSALLCADGYWAAFLLPYIAMYAQYCL